jgi:hypothetical protein
MIWIKIRISQKKKREEIKKKKKKIYPSVYAMIPGWHEITRDPQRRSSFFKHP